MKLKARTQKRRTPGEMTKTESRYAEVLESRRLAGDIDRWDFEPQKFRLADLTYYTPDFRVVQSDGYVVYIEVKPANWQHIPNQDMSNCKLKIAAEQHPFIFIRAVEIPKKLGGGWKEEEV